MQPFLVCVSEQDAMVSLGASFFSSLFSLVDRKERAKKIKKVKIDQTRQRTLHPHPQKDGTLDDDRSLKQEYETSCDKRMHKKSVKESNSRRKRRAFGRGKTTFVIMRKRPTTNWYV